MRRLYHITTPSWKLLTVGSSSILVGTFFTARFPIVVLGFFGGDGAATSKSSAGLLDDPAEDAPLWRDIKT